MQTESLALFVQVVRRGSFAEVARQQGIAPSSVSRAMTGLEDEIGARLLTRTTRRLALTEAGQVFFERIEPLVNALEEARDATRDQVGELSGTLRLTAPVTFAELHLVEALPRFLERYPGVSIELLATNRMVDLVEEQVDVAIRLGRLSDSTHVAVRLAEMPYVCCASPGYLSGNGIPQHPMELVDHRCLRLTMATRSTRWRFSNPKGEVMDVEVQGRLAVTSTTALREWAIRGLGVVLLPRWNVAHELATGRLAAILADWQGSASDLDGAVWLLYPSRAYLPLRVRRFVTFLREALTDL
ncbi:MAG: LysR substrate-binding domain-containing protein [Myxococcota bacterium]